MKIWRVALLVGIAAWAATGAEARSRYRQGKCRVALETYDGVVLKLFRGSSCRKAMKACDRRMKEHPPSRREPMPVCRITHNEKQYEKGRPCAIKLTVERDKNDFHMRNFTARSCSQARKACKAVAKRLNKRDRSLYARCTRSSTAIW